MANINAYEKIMVQAFIASSPTLSNMSPPPNSRDVLEMIKMKQNLGFMANVATLAKGVIKAGMCYVKENVQVTKNLSFWQPSQINTTLSEEEIMMLANRKPNTNSNIYVQMIMKIITQSLSLDGIDGAAILSALEKNNNNTFTLDSTIIESISKPTTVFGTNSVEEDLSVRIPDDSNNDVMPDATSESVVNVTYNTNSEFISDMSEEPELNTSSTSRKRKHEDEDVPVKRVHWSDDYVASDDSDEEDTIQTLNDVMPYGVYTADATVL